MRALDVGELGVGVLGQGLVDLDARWMRRCG
jgi:hypothetical protein